MQLTLSLMRALTVPRATAVLLLLQFPYSFAVGQHTESSLGTTPLPLTTTQLGIGPVVGMERSTYLVRKIERHTSIVDEPSGMETLTLWFEHGKGAVTVYGSRDVPFIAGWLLPGSFDVRVTRVP